MKKKIKNTHIPVILAGILLVLLVGALIYVIFFMKDTNKKIYGEAPINKTLNIGYDTKGDVYNSLKKISYKDRKVSYFVNNEMVDKNVELAGVKSKVVGNDNVILFSEQTSPEPYILVVDKNGKTLWSKKFDTKKYSNLKLLSVYEDSQKYYVIGSYVSGKAKTIVGFIYNSTGKLEKTVTVKSGILFDSIDADNYNDGFGVYTIENNFVNVYKVSKEFKIEHTLSYADMDQRFKQGLLYVESMNIYNNKMYISTIHTVPGVSSNKYLVEVNFDNMNASIKDMITLETDYNKVINDKYIGFKRQEMDIYSFDGELVKTIDYTKLEILEDKLIDTKNETTTEYDAIMEISEVFEYKDKIIVYLTDYNTEVYDVYDKEFNLVARYVITDLFDADNDGYSICIIPSNDLYMLKTNLTSSGAITAFKATIGGK